MVPIRHILVPTDFGACSRGALDLAIDLAKAFEARITLLHCFTVPPAAMNDVAPVPLDLLQDSAQAALDEALAAAKKAYPHVVPALFFGDAWQRIVTLAKDGRTDLIVMGTHGRHGLSRVLFGSVAERTVRTSPVPVLTVSAAPEQRASLP